MKKFLLLIRAFGVGFLLSELRKFATSLSDVPEFSRFVSSRVDDIEKLTVIITDNDPDNKKQLKKLFEENREKFADDVLILAAAKIEQKLGDKDPARAQYLANLLRSIAAEDLFGDSTEMPILIIAAENAQFEKIETVNPKKGKGAKPFLPTEPEPHVIPAVEHANDFPKIEGEGLTEQEA